MAGSGGSSITTPAAQKGASPAARLASRIPARGAAIATFEGLDLATEHPPGAEDRAYGARPRIPGAEAGPWPSGRKGPVLEYWVLHPPGLGACLAVYITPTRWPHGYGGVQISI